MSENTYLVLDCGKLDRIAATRLHVPGAAAVQPLILSLQETHDIPNSFFVPINMLLLPCCDTKHEPHCRLHCSCSRERRVGERGAGSWNVVVQQQYHSLV